MTSGANQNSVLIITFMHNPTSVGKCKGGEFQAFPNGNYLQLNVPKCLGQKGR